MIINNFLLFPIIISFFVTLFLIPKWIKKAKDIGLIWEDMHKIEKYPVAGSGGVIVVLGFFIGVLTYVAYRVFLLSSHNGSLVEIFVLITVILALSMVGFIDDLFGWKRGGLKKRHRIILVVIASIPLVAINAGKSVMSFPFLGNIELGIIYPLIVIPIGIVGATTTFNFLAGYNGLEAGNGIIILFSLAFVAFFTGNSWLSIIALCMVAALLAFLIYNFSPAKIFPGDSLTYSVGGLIAVMSILGNFEKVAVFFFIPYILETLLKSRGRLTKQSFGKVNPDESLDLRYQKIYSLNHIAIYLMKKLNIRPTEKKVVFSVWFFHIIIVVIGLLLFKRGIFR